MPIAAKSSYSVPTVAEVVESRLRPAAIAIDRDGIYPAEIMREFGAAGAFVHLADGLGGLTRQVDLMPTIDAIAEAAQVCGATAFCCWCQAALIWYLRCTDNLPLRKRMLAQAASGNLLGGTALSNPMKAAVGLEDLLLKGQRSEDGRGWIVNGVIPWVSNIEHGHPFAAVFDRKGEPPAIAITTAGEGGPDISPNDNYEVMAGTATVVARFHSTYIDRSMILSEDAREYISRIRPGFILFQAGIGLGLIEAAALAMEATRRERSPGLPTSLLATPDQLREQARKLRKKVVQQAELAACDAGPSANETFQLRLDLAEAAIKAATSAQLMVGAIGLMRGKRAVRLVREAAFYGILTPSVRQLNHMLARLDGEQPRRLKAQGLASDAKAENP